MFKFNYEYEFVDYLIDHFVQYFNCEFMGREICIEQRKLILSGKQTMQYFSLKLKEIVLTLIPLNKLSSMSIIINQIKML